mmetsp:Transcript_98633/g.281922  ORF Transcript_98633/g.281922 Transcript_98633/m.281922 type:complete len:175 (-) Transcript_98633:503-1027(-)
MKQGRFRMVLLSLAMLVSIRRASTPYAQQDARKSNYVTDGSSKHTRIRKELEARQAAEAANDVDASGRIRNKTKDGRKVVQGRLVVPNEIKVAMPKGYEKRLCSLDADGERKYTDVPVRLFSENYDELLEIVRKHIPAQGFGSPPPVCLWRACLSLQRWMIDKLEAERAGQDEE